MKEASQTQLASILGLGTRQIRRLEKAGMPHRAEGNAKLYPLPDAVQWYIERKMREAEEGATPSALEDMRQQKLALEVELKRRQAAEARGELVPLTWMEEQFEEAATTWAAIVRSAPTRYGATVRPDDPSAGEEALERMVDDLLDELSHAFDREGGED